MSEHPIATCAPFRAWIEDAADGALGPREHTLLQTHLRECPACRSAHASNARLVGLLAAVRQRVPVLDVRARVMESVKTEAETAGLRARVAVRAFWSGMAAAVAIVWALAAFARRAMQALPAEAQPGSHLLLRLTTDVWSVLKTALGTFYTLALGLLQAGLDAVRAFAHWIPAAQTAAITLLALTFLAAAVPVARALWSSQAARKVTQR
jgi:predicted anti-sigma-YlaC factor YlaD